MGGDDDALAEQRELLGRHQNFPSRVSKWLGLFSVRPLFFTQWATHAIACPVEELKVFDSDGTRLVP